MEKVIDIYRISEGNERKGSIRAVFNPKLKFMVKKSVINLNSYGAITKFCKELNIPYTTFWDYLNRKEYIPLFVIKKLEEFSKINLKKYVHYLEYGIGSAKKRVKVAQFCEEFASIIGAFIADGHLKKRETTWNERKPIHYELIFREEYHSNMLALAGWLNKVFEINIKPKKEENHYFIYISNKIIFRYFTNIFSFKSGRKTETVEIPKVLCDSTDKIKKAVIKGILMFDGSVSRKNGYIELYSKSRNLIIGVAKLLSEIGQPPDYICLKEDNYGRYRLIIRKRAKLTGSLELFEPGTEKYLRLRKILERFKNKI